VNQGVPRPPRVLIIEDEAGLLEILELNFRGAGYEVSTASDGVTAWQQFERQSPDLLILDLNLPQVSGFRLLELVRRESDLPVLILTAYDFAEAEDGPRRFHRQTLFQSVYVAAQHVEIAATRVHVADVSAACGQNRAMLTV